MERTFQLWYHTTHQGLTLKGETAKALLLQRSYQTVIQFQIYYHSQGVEYEDNLLIHRCAKMLNDLCGRYGVV